METDKLEALLKAATPGPWRLVADEEGEPAQCIMGRGWDIATAWGGYNAAEHDAALIAAAPDLAAEVLRLRAEKAEAERGTLRAELDKWMERCGRERAFASSHRIRAEAAEAEVARLRHEIHEASDPDFLFGAMDNVNDMDANMTTFADAASRAIRAALTPKGADHGQT